ncbi:hypothetical protein [Lactiplantibacillus mudanjiangensis]|nr:hypothetical protein [Lactiplantibacillus mudanjiangensis]
MKRHVFATLAFRQLRQHLPEIAILIVPGLILQTVFVGMWDSLFGFVTD